MAELTSIPNRIVRFLEQVYDQKRAIHPKILILSDFWAKYLVSRFATLSELSLKVVELYSASNSALNGTNFNPWSSRNISDED